jgi:hypothetical protein
VSRASALNRLVMAWIGDDMLTETEARVLEAICDAVRDVAKEARSAQTVSDCVHLLDKIHKHVVASRTPSGD